VKSFATFSFADLLHFSDVFFAIWFNSIPSQFNLHIRPLPSDEGVVGFSSTTNFLRYQHEASVLAIRILEGQLRSTSSQTNESLSFSRDERRRFPYCVKTPSRNDDLIFLTNILPVDISRIPFNIANDAQRGTRSNLPHGDKVKSFCAHSTLHAVDNNNESCWRANRSTRPGDFFAVDLLSIRTNVSLSLAIGHSSTIQKQLELKISLDGRWWIAYRSHDGISISHLQSTADHMLTINASQFNHGFRSFRYLAFNATSSIAEELKVCDVQLLFSSIISS
jgi:hypothetical protein